MGRDPERNDLCDVLRLRARGGGSPLENFLERVGSKAAPLMRKGSLPAGRDLPEGPVRVAHRAQSAAGGFAITILDALHARRYEEFNDDQVELYGQEFAQAASRTVFPQ